MQRREFVASSLGASLVPTLGHASGSAEDAAAASSSVRPQLLELRHYRFRQGGMAARHAEYAKAALVPALNRAGVKPVGAFSVSIGPHSPSVYMLLPHPNAESVVSVGQKVAEDPEYRSAATAFRALPASDPPYVRRDSSLMIAFDGVPMVEVPTGPLAAPSRVFELRTYESHNENANLKKIEMFDKAGEIAIFRRVGLTPVFFGRNLVGSMLPSLTYMVVFPDAAAREKNWAAFGEDAEWVKLRSTAGYTNAEIVSNTHNVLLRPAAYSQI